ncbi:PHP domain-containing protein [Patescibacteria group bacterium]|nr:PHP domain-containing protein [Patescibacteria group bacterium]MBU1074947.1 PHP domain-containing protein [Patescibacteria group bacterium]MBU1951680.1 PHP domain-containing protein [Patescibacteria group bacterium]MBU2229568.1 PHP domain-containing protein [Patescibacteria group bacterium]
MKYCDLHLHSHYSGGDLSCEELVDRAAERNITAIALADHNTIYGVAEMIVAGKKKGVEIVPAVEIYTEYKGKGLHLLGYNFDLDHLKLNQVLDNLQAQHVDNVKKAFAKLKEYGFSIDYKSIQSLPTKYISVAAIIDVLCGPPENYKIVQKDCGKPDPDLFEIINKYFAKRSLSPIIHSSLLTPDAIKLVKEAGGVAILAHPGHRLTWEEDTIILELKEEGLVGIEAISSYHNWHQVEHYQYFAKKHGLVITGGSDFHSETRSRGNIINSMQDYMHIPYAIYENFKNIL